MLFLLELLMIGIIGLKDCFVMLMDGRISVENVIKKRQMKKIKSEGRKKLLTKSSKSEIILLRDW